MDDAPEILDARTEQAVLYERVSSGVARIIRTALNPDLTVGNDADIIARMAITGFIMRLRLLSARQLAVLLASEADRKSLAIIEEPPRYTAEEIEDVS